MEITHYEIENIGRYDDYFGENSIEDEDSYILRKRISDLSRVIDKIILDELTEIERSIIFECEVMDKPPKEIAKEKNMSAGTVYKIRSRALGKIRSFLKYVLLFKNESESALFLPVEFRKMMTLTFDKISPSKSLHHRLRKLMAQENISTPVLSKALKKKLNEVESLVNGTRSPDNDELIILSRFFRTSTDYLLSGAN